MRLCRWMVLGVLFAAGLDFNRADAADEAGQLVVCIASKGQFDHGDPADREGLSGLAAVAHKYGFPITYYLKPFAVEASKDDLKAWHTQYGDEVGWFSEGTGFGKATNELKRLQELVTWHPIRATGNTKYGPEWIKLYLEHGIESVWGRCYEQTFVDGITDRGCPPGFYYAEPDCFKAPNKGKGGVVSVPWLSNDLNLCFRTGWQPTFTFDVNDTQDIDVSTPLDTSFFEAELDEYQKQTRYNKVVPLVVQQELSEFQFTGASPFKMKWKKDGAVILDNLFKILKRRGIKVVTVSQAVDLYKQAYPERTPPTFAVFGNISNIPIIKTNTYFKLCTERFTKGVGPTINGYYACTRTGKIRSYYNPKGVSMYEQGKNLTYFDENGLLIYEEGNPLPIRITSYFNLPLHAYKEKILPELSYWFDTDKDIPVASIKNEKTGQGWHVVVEVSSKQLLPYGVILWGDYSGLNIPVNAPRGTKVVGADGLFIPMVLKPGVNMVDLTFNN